MRYMSTPTMTFIDANGVANEVYQMRVIPKYQTAQTIQRTAGEDFDEIYTRTEMAGPDMEGQSFVLHEANIQAILDAHLDYDKIRKIKIPQVSQL